MLYLDFETRSRVGLGAVGAWNYATHPSTKVLCAAYAVDDGPVKLWRAWAGEVPPNLSEHEVEAHNVFFERCIWTLLLKWPEPSNWHCSMAKAAYWSLPQSLAGGCEALRLPIRKDEEGRQLMLRMCKPLKDGSWLEDSTSMERLGAYCVQDVEAERALTNAIPGLPPREEAIWRFDQAMNERGILVDTEFAKTASKRARILKQELAESVEREYGFKPTQRAKVGAYLNLPDTTAHTLTRALLDPAKADLAGKVLAANRTSTRKFDRALEHASPIDCRARDQLRYSGASTHRWTAKGLQVQNFPRGFSDNMDEAVGRVETADMDELVGMSRGMLMAPEGYRFFIGDFSAIEARIIFWLAKASKPLSAFRDGRDLYAEYASKMFRTKITKEQPMKRHFGKMNILSFGFGMGFVRALVAAMNQYKLTFTAEQSREIAGDHYEEFAAYVRYRLRREGPTIAESLKKANIDVMNHGPQLALMAYAVSLYRNSYPEVPDLWHEEEANAMEALASEGRAGRWRYETKPWPMLVAELPSGSELFYARPYHDNRKGITYYSFKNNLWCEVSTYGGKLTENVVQAAARDALADSMLRLRGTDYERVVLTAHDEVVVEVEKGRGRLEEFEDILAKPEPWLSSCPLAAEAVEAKRYRK